MDVIEIGAITRTFYLAFVIWREARGEPIEVRIAVAWSILNRVAKPSWWGRDVDQVVTKAWQYSSLTDPRDPQLAKAWPLIDDKQWRECMEIAQNVLRNAIPCPLPGADSYYDTSIPAPSWTAQARFCGQLGRIRFYDTDRDYEAAATGHAA